MKKRFILLSIVLAAALLALTGCGASPTDAASSTSTSDLTVIGFSQVGFAEHKVGALRGVGNELDFVSKTSEQNGDDEWSACQSEFCRHRHSGEINRNASCQNTYKNTEKDGNDMRFVQSLQGVAKQGFHLFYGVEFAYHHYAVAHLQHKVGTPEQVDARTIDARDVDAVERTQVQVADGFAVDVVLRDDNASRYELRVLSLPFHFGGFAEESHNGFKIVFRGDNQNRVVFCGKTLSECKGIIGRKFVISRLLHNGKGR